MTNNLDYSVKLGSIARTLIYQDLKGTITFTFDVDTIDGQNTIFLDRPSKSLIDSEQLRISLAYDRVREYLVSHGHSVDVSGAKV